MPLSKKFLKKNHGKNFMININKAPAEIFKGSPEETPVKVLGKKSSIHPKKKLRDIPGATSEGIFEKKSQKKLREKLHVQLRLQEKPHEHRSDTSREIARGNLLRK